MVYTYNKIKVMYQGSKYSVTFKNRAILFDFTFTAYLQDDKAICSGEQRVNRMKHYCKLQQTVSNKQFPKPDMMSSTQLKKVVQYILVDDKHKILYCDTAKSG